MKGYVDGKVVDEVEFMEDEKKIECSSCPKKINYMKDKYFETHHWTFDDKNNRIMENEYFCSFQCMKEFMD